MVDPISINYSVSRLKSVNNRNLAHKQKGQYRSSKECVCNEDDTLIFVFDRVDTCVTWCNFGSNVLINIMLPEAILIFDRRTDRNESYSTETTYNAQPTSLFKRLRDCKNGQNNIWFYCRVDLNSQH